MCAATGFTKGSSRPREGRAGEVVKFLGVVEQWRNGDNKLARRRFLGADKNVTSERPLLFYPY